MSEQHGGPVIQKPISEAARFIKSLLPAHIPEAYALKPMLAGVANEESIRRGVVAFRDFLHVFCDCIIAHGDVYAKPPKNPKHDTDYPFLRYIESLLIDIGFHGILAESGDALLVTQIPAFTAQTDINGKVRKAAIPLHQQRECLRFLTLCGFVIDGIDWEAKAPRVTETQCLVVSYPGAPILLTGLKAMSVANAEPRGDRWRSGWRNNDVFLRCDYRILKAEDADVLDYLTDFIQPLPENTQKLVLAWHRRYTDMGMTCLAFASLFEYRFAYAYTKKSRRTLSSQEIYQKRVWELALTPKRSYCIMVRAKHTDQYTGLIQDFPAPLRERIERGYGCDRKLRGEKCQGGCQGIPVPLDETALGMQRDMETWLDKEVSYVVQ